MLSGLENPMHWLILLIIALLVLGPKRLPEVGRALGRGMREFKDALTSASGPDEESRPSEPQPVPHGHDQQA